MNTKLFVGNLSFTMSENDLLDVFTPHGTVLETRIMTDRMTGRPRGFGFVTMSTEEEAERAIESLNGAAFDGRNLTVNLARPREDRPPSREGGGGGGGGGGFRGDRGDRRGGPRGGGGGGGGRSGGFRGGY